MVIICESNPTKLPMTQTEHFEQSITKLEAIVSRLEKGDLNLEDALLQYETGIHLARTCQTTLRQAEQKIDSLSANLSQSVEANHD